MAEPEWSSPEVDTEIATPARHAPEAYEKSTAKLTVRSAKETATFFDGMDLLDPGVVLLPRWRPDGRVPRDADDIWMYGALGRKK